MFPVADILLHKKQSKSENRLKTPSGTLKVLCFEFKSSIRLIIVTRKEIGGFQADEVKSVTGRQTMFWEACFMVLTSFYFYYCYTLPRIIRPAKSSNPFPKMRTEPNT